MPLKFPLAVGLAGALAVLPLSALADRAATADERARIEAVLRAEGFTAWEEIEFDDDVWEVDDARGADGREYDLQLDPSSFKIMKRSED